MNSQVSRHSSLILLLLAVLTGTYAVDLSETSPILALQLATGCINEQSRVGEAILVATFRLEFPAFARLHRDGTIVAAARHVGLPLPEPLEWVLSNSSQILPTQAGSVTRRAPVLFDIDIVDSVGNYFQATSRIEYLLENPHSNEHENSTVTVSIEGCCLPQEGPSSLSSPFQVWQEQEVHLSVAAKSGSSCQTQLPGLPAAFAIQDNGNLPILIPQVPVSTCLGVGKLSEVATISNDTLSFVAGSLMGDYVMALCFQAASESGHASDHPPSSIWIGKVRLAQATPVLSRTHDRHNSSFNATSEEGLTTTFFDCDLPFPHAPSASPLHVSQCPGPWQSEPLEAQKHSFSLWQGYNNLVMAKPRCGQVLDSLGNSTDACQSMCAAGSCVALPPMLPYIRLLQSENSGPVQNASLPSGNYVQSSQIVDARLPEAIFSVDACRLPRHSFTHGICSAVYAGGMVGPLRCSSAKVMIDEGTEITLDGEAAGGILQVYSGAGFKGILIAKDHAFDQVQNFSMHSAPASLRGIWITKLQYARGGSSILTNVTWKAPAYSASSTSENICFSVTDLGHTCSYPADLPAKFSTDNPPTHEETMIQSTDWRFDRRVVKPRTTTSCWKFKVSKCVWRQSLLEAKQQTLADVADAIGVHWLTLVSLNQHRFDWIREATASTVVPQGDTLRIGHTINLSPNSALSMRGLAGVGERFGVSATTMVTYNADIPASARNVSGLDICVVSDSCSFDVETSIPLERASRPSLLQDLVPNPEL